MKGEARADELFQQEYWSAAIEAALRERQGAAPDRQAELALLVARAFEKQAQYPDALGWLKLALASAPEHARVLAHRGGIFQILGVRERARQDLDRAVALDPEYAYAWEFLFYNSYDAGDDATRDGALDQLVRLGAETGYCYRLRGTRRLRDGDPSGAESDFRRACAHTKGDAIASEELARAGMALQTGDEHALLGVRRAEHDPASAIDDILKAFELGIAIPRRDVRAAERLAGLLSKAGRDSDAVATVVAISERHPDRADAWLARAAVEGETGLFERAWRLSEEEAAVAYARHLLGNGRAREALEITARRLRTAPNDAAALAVEGDAHFALGDRESAKTAWLRAEELGYSNARRARVAALGCERGLDHFDAALELLDRRMTGDAVAEFETAIGLFRKEARVPGDAAERYLAKSLYNSALLRELQVEDAVIEPHLREAVRLDPFHADAMLALGNLCLRTERIDEGMEWFEKAGNTNPAAGQPWFYRARHFRDIGELERTVEDATKAFDAYSRRGQTAFAADAVMMRGEANEELGKLHDAKVDYDLAHDYGHAIGFSRGDQIREKIAIAEPKGKEAEELRRKVIERIQRNECPWAQIGFLQSRTGNDEGVRLLVAKLQKESLLDEELQTLVRFLEADALMES